jgi:hypothetical protein
LSQGGHRLQGGGDHRPAFGKSREQLRLLRVGVSQHIDALCERGVTPLASAHIPQVQEQLHRGSVVRRTFAPNQRIDPLPRPTFPLRQVSQVSNAGGLFLAIPGRAFVGLTLASGLASSLCDRFSRARSSPTVCKGKEAARPCAR